MPAIQKPCDPLSPSVEPYGSTLGESGSHGFWIAGIAQTETVNLDTACGEGYVASKTETVFSAKNILITMLTLGIYTQRDYKVYCSIEQYTL